MIRIRPEQLAVFVTQRADAFIHAQVAEMAHAATGPAPRASRLAPSSSPGSKLPSRADFAPRRAVRDWITEPGLSEDERLAVVDEHANEIRRAND